MFWKIYRKLLMYFCFSQTTIWGSRLGFHFYRCKVEACGAKRKNLVGMVLLLTLKQLKQWTGLNILIMKNSSVSQNGELDNLCVFSSYAVKMVALWISYWKLLERSGIIWALQPIFLNIICKPADFNITHRLFLYYMFPRCRAVITSCRIWYDSSSIFFQGIMEGFHMNSLVLGLVLEEVITTK